MNRIAGALTVLLLATAAFADTVREGEHARIVCHFDSEVAAEAALPYAEEAVAITLEIHGLRASEFEDRAEVHLYRTPKDYREVEARLTEGRFRTNNAFSDFSTRTAHIAVVPECGDAVLKALGLSEVVLRQIAHEVAHLVVYHVIPSFENHPDWLSEGMATTVATRVVEKLGLCPDAARAPFSSTRMALVRKLAARGKLPGPEAVFPGDLGGMSTNERYSVWWLFFRYLTEHESPRMKKLMARAVSQGGGATYGKRLAEYAAKLWGSRGLKRIEAGFSKYVDELKPEWEQVYRSLEIREGGLHQRAYGEVNAVAWRTEPVGRSSFSLAGEIEILPSGNPQMNVLLGRSDGGFVSIALRAGFGVTVFDFRSSGSQWNNLGAVEVDALRTGDRVPFEVRVIGERISIRISGEPVLDVVARDCDLAGCWGLGVQSTGAGVWHDVRIE